MLCRKERTCINSSRPTSWRSIAGKPDSRQVLLEYSRLKFLGFGALSQGSQRWSFDRQASHPQMSQTEIFSPDTAANIVLAVLALLIAAIGVAAWWVAAHPKEVRSLVSRLGVRPRVLRFRRHFHSQIEFLVHRFQPEGAFGLSFTVGLVVLIASTWILGGVLEDVARHKEVALFDAPIVSYLAAHRIGWLTMTMRRNYPTWRRLIRSFPGHCGRSHSAAVQRKLASDVAPCRCSYRNQGDRAANKIRDRPFSPAN